MKICLDTDFLVALLRNNPDAVKKAEELDSTDMEISTTTMNAFELYFGAYRSASAEKNLKETDELLDSLTLLTLSKESSKKASEILLRLFKIGEPVDVRDVIIAGIALVENNVLLARNIAHFSRIIGLTLEEW